MVTEEEIEMFVFEAEGHLQKCEKEIINFENNPKDKNSIKEISYSFQALKALTPMVNLNNTSKYCNYYESLLSKILKNDGEIKKADNLINLIYESLDNLNSILNEVKKGNLKDMDEDMIDIQMDSIKSYESDYEITFIEPIPLNEIDAVIRDIKKNFYKIYFKIRETCKFKRVRIFFIFRALNKVGQICWSNPEPEILESADFEFDFDIFYMSKKKHDEIYEILDEILEIETKEISKLKPKEFKQIITNYTLKWQKAKEKLAKFEEHKTELGKSHELNFIYPITYNEFLTIKNDLKNIFYYIYIRLKLTCKNKKARLYFILNALNSYGHLCWSNPKPSLLEKGIISLDFELYFISTKRIHEIKAELEKILEIDRMFIVETSINEFQKVISQSTLMEEKNEQKEEIHSKLIEEIIENKKEKIILDGIQNKKIIFTDTINNLNKISLPDQQFIDLLESDKSKTVFSCYKDDNNKNEFILYVIKEGMCFVAKGEDSYKYEIIFKIDEKGFKRFEDYLEAVSFGVDNYEEFLSIKETKT